jgi:hypothetical protein
MKDDLLGGVPGPGGGGSTPSEMVASLDHVVVSSLEVESRAVMGFAGRISVVRKVAFGGKPRSSDQPMMAFLCHFLRGGIS